MIEAYQNCQLFKGLSEEEINTLIRISNSQVRKYQRNQLIFDQYDKPEYMYVLLSGCVNVGKDYLDGHESHMTTFTRPGEIFAEILLFLGKEHYDFYARAAGETSVLAIPRSFLTEEYGRDNKLQHQLIANTMIVFANKAYFLQRRVQVLSLNTLRKRLAKAILFETSPNQSMKMSRETLAGYVNAARPSVSRELSSMEQDGLITLKNSCIYIKNRKMLEEISE